MESAYYRRKIYFHPKMWSEVIKMAELFHADRTMRSRFSIQLMECPILSPIIIWENLQVKHLALSVLQKYE
jgi:hypothetical protein